MVAGYDTTAITLCWLSYQLALNPDVQDKLIAEIDQNIGKVTLSLSLSLSLSQHRLHITSTA